MLNLGKRWGRFSHLKNTFVKILEYGVERIVYISCKMTSLARDLEMMQIAGYRVEKMTAVDQFCETVHVETVVLMSKVKE